MKFEIIAKTENVNDLRMRLLEKQAELAKSTLMLEIRELERNLLQAEKAMSKEEADIIEQMLGFGVTEITKDGVKYSIRNTAREKVVIEDESLVPEEYLRVKKEVDKKAIMAMYKECGVLIEGTDVQKEDAFKLFIKAVK
ncbi:MAG: siphovirus Gp157 family protein [Cetobacterium sp.]|uniref:siphovirus Gp157 family protein n=1 Tax=Cetobacterium sp. TaxID=2071632 RepID=UPI003F3E0F4A